MIDTHVTELTGLIFVRNSPEGYNVYIGESFQLTAVFFETGAMLTPTKSQNGTNCGSGGSFQSYLTHS